MARSSLEAKQEALRLNDLLMRINFPQDAAQVLWKATNIHYAHGKWTVKALKT